MVAGEDELERGVCVVGDVVVGMATGEDKGDEGRGQGASVRRTVLGRGLDTKGGQAVGAGKEGMGRGGRRVGAGGGGGRPGATRTGTGVTDPPGVCGGHRVGGDAGGGRGNGRVTRARRGLGVGTE